MYPATITIQKEMLPIMDRDGIVKPAIQIIIEEALDSGIEEVCLIVNRTNRAQIEAHFNGAEPPKTYVAEIERTPGFSSGILSQAKRDNWDAMCQYTHTGGLHLKQWQKADFARLIGEGGWPDVDPRRTVLLEEAPADAPNGGVAGTVRILRYDNTDIEIDADAPSGGFVVLNDVWHP